MIFYFWMNKMLPQMNFFIMTGKLEVLRKCQFRSR